MNDYSPESSNSKKDRAILALLEHGSKEKAAQAAGVDPTTLWRWLKTPDFQQALREARREAVSHSMARLQQSSAEAVNTLLSVMSDPHAPAHSRVRAAQCALAMTHRSFEVEEIEARVAKLEKLANSQDATKP